MAHLYGGEDAWPQMPLLNASLMLTPKSQLRPPPRLRLRPIRSWRCVMSAESATQRKMAL